MAILQAILALIGKSAGKILNAIFGWAVRALFGQSSARQQTFLSALVAAAVAWPLLLLGVAFPRIAALLLAFVPIPHWIPSWTIRVVWLALVLVVPLALGLAIGAKAPPGTASESFGKRMARGFPITLGLSAAFIIMFVSVPVMRLAALIRKERSASIPAITTARAYHQMATIAIDVLNRAGFDLHPGQPGWWVAAPTRILGWFGGNAFAAFVPTKMEHFESADLSVSFYPSGVLLRGNPQKTTWAHGLVTEALLRTDALQSADPKAQELEKEIRRLWKAFQGISSRGTTQATESVNEVIRQLGCLNMEFDDWQVLYRQMLQLGRTLHGERQLLEQKARTGELRTTGEPAEASEAADTPPETSDTMPDVRYVQHHG
jgi:hypothetical protein